MSKLFSLFSEIITKLNSKASLIDGKVPLSQLPDNIGGGGGEDELITVTCDIDLTTLQASNFTRTYQEIVNLVEAGKTVKLKCDYVAGICFGDLVVQNYSQNVVIFQIIIQMQIGTLYYINMMLSDSGVNVIPYLVQTTKVGG